ncbi:hypothetical protein JCM8097_000641 [Rhodosporidiobolus ruineniae]
MPRLRSSAALHDAQEIASDGDHVASPAGANDADADEVDGDGLKTDDERTTLAEGAPASDLVAARQIEVVEDFEAPAFAGRSSPAPTPKKRSRSAASSSSSKKRKYGGKLELFQAVPVDVLHEIAFHLDPLSLLRLSRSSKRLHALFASKSTEPLWRSVLEYAGLPKLQAPDMNPMRIVVLTLARDCMACGGGNALQVRWDFRVRVCARCKHSPFDWPDGIKCKHALHPATFDTLPRYGQYFIPHVLARSAELDKLSAAQTAELAPYWEEIAKASTADYSALKYWESVTSALRVKTADEVKRVRRQEIEARLAQLGFASADIQAMINDTTKTGHKLVLQPKPLTDRIWQNLERQLVPLVEHQRDARLASEATSRRNARRLALLPFYHAALASLPSSEQEVFPPFFHLTEEPSLRLLWEGEDATASEAAWDAALADTSLLRASVRFKANLMEEVQRASQNTSGFVDRLPAELHPSFVFVDFSSSSAAELAEAERELDAILSNSTLRRLLNDHPACRCAYDPARPHYSASYRSVLVHLRDCPAIYGSGGAVSQPLQGRRWGWCAPFAQQCLAALEIGSEWRTCTTEQLNGLGKVFKCTSYSGWRTCAKKATNWSGLLGHWECTQQSNVHSLDLFAVLAPE